MAIHPIIRRLDISRFRGIENLEWLPDSGANVLIGGGDSGKSTILHAIALLFSPTNAVQILETDYFNRVSENGFTIEAVVELPDEVGINKLQQTLWPWTWSGKSAVLPDPDASESPEIPVYRFRVRGTSELDPTWLFFQNVPLALAAMLFASAGLPDTGRSSRRFDIASALLCAITFSCLLFGIAGAAQIGWKASSLALLAAVVVGYLLHRRDASSDAPMFATDLFRSPFFTLSAATSACSFAVQGAIFVVLPFLFKFEMGYTQVQAGLLITPWPAALAVMTLIAPPLAQKISPGILGAAGMTIVAIGLAFLATMPVTADYLAIGWRLLVCGIGFGLFQSPNMVALMTSAPKERSGGAGGILATSRLIGQSVGAAAVAFCPSTWPHGGAIAAVWLSAGFALFAGTASIVRMMPSLRGA